MQPSLELAEIGIRQTGQVGELAQAELGQLALTAQVVAERSQRIVVCIGVVVAHLVLLAENE